MVATLCLPWLDHATCGRILQDSVHPVSISGGIPQDSVCPACPILCAICGGIPQDSVRPFCPILYVPAWQAVMHKYCLFP